MSQNAVVIKSLFTSHDKKLLPILIAMGIFFLLCSPRIIDLVVKSVFFNWILRVNIFVARMVNQSYQHNFAFFCYGFSFLITPYILYILLRSNSLRKGIEIRYKKGGRPALFLSAVGSVVIFAGIFFHFQDFSPEQLNRINYFMFYSRIGIAIFSLGITYFLVLMLACSFLYIQEFLKRGK